MMRKLLPVFTVICACSYQGSRNPDAPQAFELSPETCAAETPVTTESLSGDEFRCKLEASRTLPENVYDCAFIKIPSGVLEVEKSIKNATWKVQRTGSESGLIISANQLWTATVANGHQMNVESTHKLVTYKATCVSGSTPPVDSQCRSSERDLMCNIYGKDVLVTKDKRDFRPSPANNASDYHPGVKRGDNCDVAIEAAVSTTGGAHTVVKGSAGLSSIALSYEGVGDISCRAVN